jgi:glycerophosphoryl diester phosphodiesterase
MRKKPWLRMTIGLLIFLLLTLLYPFVRFLFFSSEVSPEAKRPLVIGHRGAAGLAPENTLASFERSVAFSDVIELDVHLTRDDSIIVIHDRSVDRTTNGTGDVIDLSFDDIRKLDAGSWFGNGEFKNEKVPTLMEVLSLVNGRKKLLIELKWPSKGIYPNLVKRTIADIRAARAESWVILQSFEQTYVKEAIELAPDIPCHQIIFGYCSFPPLYYDRSFHLGNYPVISGAKSLNIFYYYLSPHFLFEIKKLGVGVCTYTVNDEKNFRKLINLGVDGIITDRPDKLQTTLLPIFGAEKSR